MAGNGVELIEIWSSEDDLSSPESILCYAKTTAQIKKQTIVQDIDCVILDFDPFVTIDFDKKLSVEDEDTDLSVTAERGQVACRDYPHSRHLCAQFPFSKTPHESYCKQCYCYVCDTLAPCKYWKGKVIQHCHAYEDDPKWKNLRRMRQSCNKQ